MRATSSWLLPIGPAYTSRSHREGGSTLPYKGPSTIEDNCMIFFDFFFSAKFLSGGHLGRFTIPSVLLFSLWNASSGQYFFPNRTLKTKKGSQGTVRHSKSVAGLCNLFSPGYYLWNERLIYLSWLPYHTLNCIKVAMKKDPGVSPECLPRPHVTMSL